MNKLLNTLTGIELTQRMIKARHPQLFDWVHATITLDIPFNEKVYLIRYDQTQPPACLECGAPVKFINQKDGYAKYCCKSCADKSEISKHLRRETNIQRYGGPVPQCSVSVKEKTKKTQRNSSAYKNRVKKIKSTNRIKYGVNFPLQNEMIRERAHQSIIEGGGYTMCREDLRKKVHDTMLERYGVKSIFQDKKRMADIRSKYDYDLIQKKMRKTSMERYGVEISSQNPNIARKISLTKRSNNLSSHPDVIGYTEDGQWMCKCPHPECHRCDEKMYIIPSSYYASRKIYNSETCTHLRPIIPQQEQNTYIELFVQRILDEHNINYIKQYKIGDIRVDFFIPDKKIVIECNGVYWHSDYFKTPAEHAQRKSFINHNGYQMITIWEDWVVRQPDNVRNVLLSKLDIYDRKVFARCCEVREINQCEYNKFLRYHIQGSCNSPVRYGLYYKNELISVMGFGKKRRSMMGTSVDDGSIELMRFCCVPGIRVVGGAGKLLSRYIRLHQPKIIISFSSNDISEGKMYASLGFKKEKTNKSYWYIDRQMNRHHRYKYRKSELIKNGADASKSESELTREMGLYRIYDTGQTKWVLNLQR